MNDIESLAAALQSAKRAEDLARAERLRIEKEICNQLDLPAEGSAHVESGPWKVTVTSAIRRTLDENKLREIAHQIPDEIGAKLIRWKPDLVIKELRSVQQYRPDVYAALSIAITATPAKPSVKLAHLNEEAA